MRIDKFLVECGIGSRREVKDFISKGLVYINEKMAKSPKDKVKETQDEIFFDNLKLEYKSERYYIMYKPAGCVTATKDFKEKTVMDILPEWVNKKDLFPVGRLDKDTEGLLLFTNNGKLAHQLVSPKKHVKKKYYVELEKSIYEKDIEKLKEGVVILDDYKTKKAEVEKVGDKKIFLTITEGKFHQVKEMLKSVGNKVVYLKRVSFGNLNLEGMKVGEVKEITIEDITRGSYE
jgi:16S rRNA pseudouridine516 synthase